MSLFEPIGLKRIQPCLIFLCKASPAGWNLRPQMKHLIFVTGFFPDRSLRLDLCRAMTGAPAQYARCSSSWSSGK